MAFSNFVTDINSLLAFIGERLKGRRALYTYKSDTYDEWTTATTWAYMITTQNASDYAYEDLAQSVFFCEGPSATVIADNFYVYRGLSYIAFSVTFSSAVGSNSKMCATTPVNVAGTWTAPTPPQH